jgi:hypothetical protein
MHICEKDNKYASDVWMDLSENKKVTFQYFSKHSNFLGKGRKTSL